MDQNTEQYDTILNALQNAISALNGSPQPRGETQQRRQRRQQYLRNLFSTDQVDLQNGTHWCHDCQAKVEVDEQMQCVTCKGYFVEENEDSPHEFQIPEIRNEPLAETGLPQSLQNQLDNDQDRRRIQNEQLVQNILDMALSRIRSTNSEFRDATLTGAQIRVRGGMNIHAHPLALLQGGPDGVMQDMMLADVLSQQRLGDLPEGPIQINRLPLGLLQMLTGGQEQSMQDIIQHIMENDPNRYGPPPASKEAIQALSKRDILEYRNTKTDCCVCLTIIGDVTDEELEKMENRVIIEMPCEHTFHQECILPWLKEHNSCPKCRFELPTEDGENEKKQQIIVPYNYGNP